MIKLVLKPLVDALKKEDFLGASAGANGLSITHWCKIFVLYFTSLSKPLDEGGFVMEVNSYKNGACPKITNMSRKYLL